MQFWRGVFLLLVLPWAAHSQVQITPTSLPNGLLGSVYGTRVTSPCNFTSPLVAMSASTQAPFDWSVVNGSGSLPPGVTISGAGVFAGEPTQAGTFSFRLRVRDAQDVTGERNFSIQVLPPPNCGPLNGQVGQAMNLSFACSGESSIMYSSPGGAFPPGVSVNSLTGAVAGTPTQAGSFSALWRCQGPQRVSITENLQFVITGGTALTAAPTRFDFDLAGEEKATQPLVIQTASANAVPFSVQAVTASGGNWLGLVGNSGNVSAGQPATVQLAADAGGVPPGVYTATVTVNGGSAPLVVPVTLTVRRFDRQLGLSQAGVAIETEQGAAPFTRSFFRVTDQGNGPSGLDWTASAQTLSGGNWLSPLPASGNTNDFRSEGEGAAINPTGLQPGVYYGLLEVSSPGAGNSPQQTTVTLNVRGAGQAAVPLATPGGAIVVAEQNSNTTVQQFIQLTNTGASALTYTGTATTESGGAWLDAGSSGAISIGATVGHGLTIQVGALPQGVYRGEAKLSFSNGTALRIRIALVVVPPGTLGAPLTAGRRQQSACAPNVAVPVFTQVGSGGPPETGFAQPITVQVVDDCGNPVNSGSALVLIPGTDQQIPLQNFGGEWGGTWTPAPGGGGNQVTLTAEVTSEEGLQGASSDDVMLQSSANPPPAVFDQGVVHAASFEGEPLAAGSMISIFGTDLSAATVESGGVGAPSLPLGVELAGTRVVVAGTPLPLLFARADQVNAILPFELGDRSTEELSLVVERTDKAAISTAVPIRFSRSRPGVFPGSVLDQQFAFVTGFSPAAAGEAVQVYASGLGLVDPPVTTADAAKADPLSRAVEEVRVTVGGVEAQVLYAGLSPNFAGLFQVNFVVPQGVPAGGAELVIIAGGQPSQTTTIFVQ